MALAKVRTHTPQEYFAHVGNLESQDAIASVAKQMLHHSASGLWAVAITDDERELLGHFERLLSAYQTTSRGQWAGLKESCLLLLGSQVASVVDHLTSAMRTPAIAESAIRSAGLALIAANEEKARTTSRRFMRVLLSHVISG